MRYIHFCLFIGGIIIVFWTNVFDFVPEARISRGCGELFVTRARNRGIKSPSLSYKRSRCKHLTKTPCWSPWSTAFLVTLPSESARRRSTLVLVDDDNAFEAIPNRRVASRPSPRPLFSASLLSLSQHYRNNDTWITRVRFRLYRRPPPHLR